MLGCDGDSTAQLLCVGCLSGSAATKPAPNRPTASAGTLANARLAGRFNQAVLQSQVQPSVHTCMCCPWSPLPPCHHCLPADHPPVACLVPTLSLHPALPQPLLLLQTQRQTLPVLLRPQRAPSPLRQTCLRPLLKTQQRLTRPPHPLAATAAPAPTPPIPTPSQPKVDGTGLHLHLLLAL